MYFGIISYNQSRIFTSYPQSIGIRSIDNRQIKIIAEGNLAAVPNDLSSAVKTIHTDNGAIAYNYFATGISNRQRTADNFISSGIVIIYLNIVTDLNNTIFTHDLDKI